MSRFRGRILATGEHEQRVRLDEAGGTNADARRPLTDPAGTPTRARLYLNDPSAASALARDLREARCVVVPQDAGTVDVVMQGFAGADVEQARMELAFFLKAWADDHPGVGPRVVWY